MFKKQDPWESGIRMVSRLLGFEDEEYEEDPFKQEKPPQKYSHLHQNHNNPLPSPTSHLPPQNGFLATRVYTEMPLNKIDKGLAKGKGDRNNSKLKQKWKKLMKSPAYKSRAKIIHLLYEEGSTLQDETWIWLMTNSQKITFQLYTLKKQTFHSLAYSPSQSRLNEFDFQYDNPNLQIQDFTIYPDVLQATNNPNIEGTGQNISSSGKKGKFSITKGSTMKVPSSTETGRSSMHSQASTFSSQTHNSNEFDTGSHFNPNSYSPSYQQPQPSQNNLAYNNMGLPISPSHPHYQERGLIQQRYSSPTSSPILPLNDRFPSEVRSPVHNCAQNSSRSSLSNYSSVYANSELIPVHCEMNNYPSTNLENFLQKLPSIVPHKALCDVLGSFLLQREDVNYSVTLFNVAATFYFYTSSNELKTFILLNHFVTTEVYMPYLVAAPQASQQSSPKGSKLEHLIYRIVESIRKNCPSAVFLKRFKLETFIETWIYSFFYSVCENGTQLKEKVFGYLLLESFSLNSITKLCEAIIQSMARVINHGIDQKTYECLQNPKAYLDQQALLHHLFAQ